MDALHRERHMRMLPLRKRRLISTATSIAAFSCSLHHELHKWGYKLHHKWRMHLLCRRTPGTDCTATKVHRLFKSRAQWVHPENVWTHPTGGIFSSHDCEPRRRSSMCMQCDCYGGVRGESPQATKRKLCYGVLLGVFFAPERASTRRLDRRSRVCHSSTQRRLDRTHERQLRAPHTVTRIQQQKDDQSALRRHRCVLRVRSSRAPVHGDSIRVPVQNSRPRLRGHDKVRVRNASGHDRRTRSLSTSALVRRLKIGTATDRVYKQKFSPPPFRYRRKTRASKTTKIKPS